MKAYTMRHNAVRAARQALGADATDGVEFRTFTSGPDDCVAWHWEPAAQTDGEAGAYDAETAWVLGERDPDRLGEIAAEGRADAPQIAQEPKVGRPARVTKGSIVLALLQREGGATNPELQEATGWQGHSVRGFFAGAQMARTGYRAERFEREPGVHAYRAVKREP